MIYSWLLFNCISLALSQHVTLNRTDRDPNCRNADLRRIAKYFRETAIVRNEDTTETHYCVKKHNSKDSYDLQYLDQVIDLYQSFEYVNPYKYIDRDGVMTHDGFLSINDYQVLPLYQIADIRRKTLPCVNTYPGLGNDVNDQMNLMGLNSTDERGYLLAHSLGGSSKAVNIIPIAINVYEHLLLVTKDEGLGIPLSNWKSNEYWIRKFLLHYYPNGRVLWKSAVQYEENVFFFPRQYQTYRPLSFSLQYVAYTNENDRSSAYYRSPKITFLNNNDYPCDTGIPCHDKEVDIKDPKFCDIQNFSTTITPKGKLGPSLNGNSWDRKYLVTIPFYMAEETLYIYQQGGLEDNAYPWVIREIQPDGQLINKYSGNYPQNRDSAFTYFINGTQYLYTHSSSDTKWFINELLPSGNISEQVTDEGIWPEKTHTKAVPFTIGGEYYFYSQWNSSDYAYFIKHLEPYGVLKKNYDANVETNPGRARGDIVVDDIIDDAKVETKPVQGRRFVVSSYIINNKHYLHAHNQENKTWTIHELLADGKMGKEVDNGNLDFSYDDSFTYSINEKVFLYGLSKEPFAMFIRELLPNGKMENNPNPDSTSDTDKHYSAVPIILNGTQYVLRDYEGLNDSNETAFLYTINQLL